METKLTAPEETALLNSLEDELQQQPAAKGTRLANLVLDVIGFYALMFVVGIGLAAYGLVTDVDSFNESYRSSILAEYALSYFVYVLYFTLAEGLTKGRSLGKLITGTVAIKEDGSAFTWKDALMRSLCRIVPFEPFSAFGYAPWHDKWTQTTVVKKLK